MQRTHSEEKVGSLEWRITCSKRKCVHGLINLDPLSIESSLPKTIIEHLVDFMDSCSCAVLTLLVSSLPKAHGVRGSVENNTASANTL